MKNHTICEQTLNLSSFSVEKVKKKETESNLMCTNITSPKKNKSEIDRQLDGKEKRKSISRNSPSILSEMEMTETNNEWENQINSMDVNMKIEDDDGNLFHHQENSFSNQILDISNKQTTKVSPINSIHSDKSFPTKFSTSIQNETNFTRSSNNLIEKSIGEIPSEISDNVSKEKSISIRRTLSFKSKNCSIRENEIIKSSNSEKYLKNSTKVLSKNLSKKSSIATIEKRTVSSLNEEEMNVGDSLEMSDKFSALSETKKLPSPILNGKSESERLTQISVLEKEIEETESNLSSKTMTSIPNSLIENSAINHKDEELNVPSQQQQQQQQTMSILKTKDNFSVELSNSSLVETSKKFDEVQNKSKNRQQKKKASPNIQVLRKLRPRNNSNLEKKQIHLSTSIKEKEVNETNVKDVGRLKIVGMLEKENDEPEEKTIWTKQKLNIFSSKIADISETIRRNRSHQNRLDENRLEKNKSDEEEISLGEETNMFFKEPKCPKDIVSGISSGGSKRYLLLKPEQSLKEMDEILNYDYSFDRTYQYDISFDEYSSEVMDKFLEKKFSFCSLNNFKNHLILLNVINRELAKAIGVKYQAVRGGYCENRNEKDSTWNINIIVLPPKCRTKVYRIKSSFLLIEPLNTQMKVEVLLSTDIERRCVIEIDRFESLYLSSKYSVIFQNENELENLNVHLLFGLHVERLLPRGINFKLKFPYDTIVKDWKNGRNVDIIYDCHFTDDRLVNNILLSKWPRNRVHHIDQEKSCPFYLPITPSQIIYFNFVINYLKEKFFSHIIEDVNDMRISLCQQNGINYRRLEITTEITNDQKHIEFPIFKSNLYDSTFIVYQGRLGMKLYRGNYPVKTFQLSDYDLKFMWIPAEQDISLQIEKVRVSRCNRAYFQMEIRQMLNRAALKKLVSDGRQSMSYIDFFQ
ncbi:hypothetical protein SNEBB_002511 [Seison nebaliae]|nr:hypothetical protein SNEBB_002511 [Seison nebaliae]